MEKEHIEILSSLTELNDAEKFLLNFLKNYPEYRLRVVGLSDKDETAYEHLLNLMSKMWKQYFPKVPFFLEGTSYYLNEDFFIPQDQNVAIRQNLRYMPFILHSHQFIELNYVLAGSGSSMITKDERLPLQDGDIILCPPGFVHCFDSQNAQSVIIDFFIRITTFDTAFFQLLNNNNYLSAIFSNALYNFGEGCIIWHCMGDTKLKDIVISAFTEWKVQKKYSGKMLEILMMQFFLILMRHHEQEAVFSVPIISSTDRLFQALLNYMHVHCQTITLSRLASQYNYSERQIIRLLKKHSGKGFSELLLDIRMNRAIQLLKNPSIPISQVAFHVGYSNTNYFLKLFKKTFTFTPEDFRRRLQRDETE